MDELPILQKTYDLIRWYVPILTRLPKSHKYVLGDRLVIDLYDLLRGLVRAKYKSEKRELLIELNINLEIIRHQNRLLHEFELIKMERYEYSSKLIDDIGKDLGGWIKQQKRDRPGPKLIQSGHS